VVQLSWSASPDNDIAFYKVYRATAAGVTQASTLVASIDPAVGDPMTGSATATNDGNALPTAPPGTTYYYRVFVVDAANQSTGSNEVSITLSDAAPAPVTLGTPTYVSDPMAPPGGEGGKAVKLSWNASLENDIASYKIYRSTTPGVTEMSALAATVTRPQPWEALPTEAFDSAAVPTAPPGTTYYYRVYVVDGLDQSAGSNEVSITLTDNPPAAVTLSTPTYGPGGGEMPPGENTNAVKLTWLPNTESDIASYKIYRSTAPGVTTAGTLAGTVTRVNPWDTLPSQFYDSGALPAPAPGATYYYRVFVFDNSGQSAGSNEVSITLTDAPPSAVTLSTPTFGGDPMMPPEMGGQAVQLSWSANTETDFASYKVYRATAPGVTQNSALAATITRPDPWTAAATTAADSGAVPTAPPGTTYYYRVFVVDSAGQATGSNEVSITLTDNPPAAVTLNTPTYTNDPMAPPEMGGQAVALSWSANTESDIASYKIYRSTTPGVTTASTLAATVTRDYPWDPLPTSAMDGAALPSPAPGTTYYYRVFVVDNANQATGSNEVSITLTDDPPPAVTLDAPVYGPDPMAPPEMGGNVVQLSWSASSAGDFGSYKLYRKASPGVSTGDTLLETITQRDPWNGTQWQYSDSPPDTGGTNLTYYYRVFVFDSSGQSTGSNEVSFVMPPLAPLAPTFQNIAATSVEVVLPALPLRATSLTLQREQGTENWVTVVSGQTGTAVVPVTGLTAGVTYNFRVLAVGPNASTLGAAATVTTLMVAPNAPQNLTATAGDGQIALSWNAAAGANSYAVNRSLAAGGPYTTIVPSQTQTTYTDTGLTNGTTYYYVVSASNAVGESPNSNEANATPLVLNVGAPDAPVLSQIAAFSLRATAPALPTNAISLTLQRKLDGAGDETYVTVATGLAAGAQTTVTGLSQATTYAFRYVAVGQAQSTPGAVATATTLSNVPVAPQSLIATPGDGQVTLSWSAVANATSYKLQRAEAAGGPYTTVATVSQTTQMDAPLTNETAYFYVVTAVNADGESPHSNEAGATPSTTPVDPPPTAVTMNAPTYGPDPMFPPEMGGGNVVQLSWSATLETDIAWYKIYRSASPGVTQAGTLVTSIDPAMGDPMTGLATATSDGGATPALAPGATYYYRVFVVDGAGQATGSNEVSITLTDTPPSAVTLATPVYGDNPMFPDGSKVVQLSWSAGTDTDLQSYKIYRATAPGVTEMSALVATVTRYDPWSPLETTYSDGAAVPTAPPGTTYYYRVYAVDGSGQSTGSNEVSILLTDNPPAAVTLNAPTYGDDPMFPGGSKVVQLSWSANTESDVVSYKIYRATAPGVTTGSTLAGTLTRNQPWETLETSYADGAALPAPPPGATYYYRVFVFDGAGQSAGSNEVSITLTDAPPAAVVLNAPTYAENPMFPGEGNKAVQLSWSANAESDLQSYKIYRATAPGVTEASTLVATLTRPDPWTPPEAQYSDGQALPTVPPGTTYYYRVFVTDGAGQTAGSNEVSILLTDTPPLAVTLAPVVYDDDPMFPGGGLPGSNKIVQLSWSASAENDIASYKIYRATAPGVTEASTLAATITRYDPWQPLETSYSDYQAIPLPPPGVTYYYRVFVVDNAGQSAGSNEESISLTDNPPSAVTLDPPTYGPNTEMPPMPGEENNAVRLRWSLSTEPDFQSYKLYRKSSPGVTQGDTLISTVTQRAPATGYRWEYDDMPPDNGSANLIYYYRVFVTDGAGQSVGSNEVLFRMPPLVPGVPQFTNITQTSVDVTLPPLPLRANSLWLQQDQNGEWVSIATNQPGEAVVHVTGLFPSTDYRFRCMAVGVDAGTPGGVGAMTTDGGAPQAPGLPTFSGLTTEGVTVQAPALPPGASWMRLEMKTDGQGDEDYVTVANELAGRAFTPVTGLTSGVTYVFRYVAAGPGGYTAGPSASVPIGSAQTSWLANEPINCGGIRWPAPDGGAATIAPGATGRLSAYLATDWDLFVVGANGQALEEHKVSDPCSYTWSATFSDGTPAGSFPSGNSGQSAVWIAPQTAGEVTIKLTVDDQNAGNIGSADLGTRNDATRGYDDAPQTFSVVVDVEEVQQ
jgi:fibronectin type 3 domain-containing protein